MSICESRKYNCYFKSRLLKATPYRLKIKPLVNIPNKLIRRPNIIKHVKEIKRLAQR